MISSGFVSAGRPVGPTTLKSWIIIEEGEVMSNEAAVHPGEILLEEFLKPLGLSPAA
jgi:hypothetical protein